MPPSLPVGFRPYRSTHHAIVRILNLIRKGYDWVIEGDIKGFFDNVDHDILLDILRRDIHDPRLLRLIRTMLKAGIMDEERFLESDVGTPQGGILSPLLGNVYLNELDAFVHQKYEGLPLHRRLKQPFRCFICRYADDFVILVKGFREQAEQLRLEVAEFLRASLRLELSMEKTLVTHVEQGFDFLGFHIRRYRRQGKATVLATPSRKAQQKTGSGFWSSTSTCPAGPSTTGGSPAAEPSTSWTTDYGGCSSGKCANGGEAGGSRAASADG